MRVILGLSVVQVSSFPSIPPALALSGLNPLFSPGQEPIAYYVGSSRRWVDDSYYQDTPADRPHHPDTFDHAGAVSGDGSCTAEAASTPRALVAMNLPYKPGTIVSATEKRRLL
jgi:hypothetical protein